ncbi:hypothetical protein [Duganella sp. HH101]|uniref:hypothetical protein n=1 Tax=Duganella sp. HH101 TaxID=1781066 RepID=UPI0008938083|nr:hypothetical protein [Duganella sp. HH101]OFA04407.1 hypothetical protein DUGA2_19520 [Duganella sp. HH101]
MKYSQYYKISSNCPRCTKNVDGALPFCKQCFFDLRFGTTKKTSTGNCIYCEATDITSEHVFGDWIARRFPDTTKGFWSWNLLRPGGDDSTKEKIYKSLGVIGRPYEQKVLNVCTACNNIWMSQLHAQAKELVITLTNGNWRDLTEKERTILTRWAIMIVFNIQSFARTVFSPRSHLSILMHGGIPPGFRLHIGRMTELRWAGLHDHKPRMFIGREVGGDQEFLCSTYFVIENVAFHLIYGYDNERLSLALSQPKFPVRIFDERMIWPSQINAKNSNIMYTWDDINALNSIFLPLAPPIETFVDNRYKKEVVKISRGAERNGKLNALDPDKT